ncbi:hypothetical protein A9239_11740 [Methanosarcina sp. A14]|nr:hypothetical protein A9239_11740 [Methanosarcina sp. A14]
MITPTAFVAGFFGQVLFKRLAVRQFLKRLTKNEIAYVKVYINYTVYNIKLNVEKHKGAWYY